MSHVRIRNVVLVALGLMVLTGFAGFLFAWAGLYSVAATQHHTALARRFLEFGMRNSVEFHSRGLRPSPRLLNNPANIERGIGHFQGGCAPCHGAPGVPPSSVAQHMLPAPSDLPKAVPTYMPRQLFWIVKHGLKYTGMPGWPAQTRDDEVWAVVAFLLRLPNLSSEEYRRLAAFAPDTKASVGEAAAFALKPLGCARCHGARGEGSEAGGIPRIAGQKVEYLAGTLSDYALGIRPSGIMGPIAQHLSASEMLELAEFYNSQDIRESKQVVQQRMTNDATLLQLGGAIASVGIPSRSIPACESCHGPKGTAGTTNPRYPALAGLHPAYLKQQLELWRAGKRGGTFDELMRSAVRTISDEEIDAVSAYYAALPPR